MAINKVDYGDQTLMDLTEDTVTEDKVLEGETFHDKSGVLRSGSLVIPVQDVEVNGESVVDPITKIAKITSYEEVTQAEYDDLSSSKESDNVLYMVYSDGGQILDPDYSYHKYGDNDEIIVRVYHEGQSDQQTLWFFRGWNQTSMAMPIPSELSAYAPLTVINQAIASKNFTDNTGKTQNGWIGFYSNSIRAWSQDWGSNVTGIIYGVVDPNGSYYPNPQTNSYIDDPYIYIPSPSTLSTRRIYLNGREYAEFNTPTTDIQTAVDEFETYNGGLLSSLKVSLSPNQDLHGYSEPWVGGAGKNKLPLTLANIKSGNTAGTWSDNVYTIYEMTYTVNTDDGGNVIDIEANGTPSYNAQLALNKTAFLSGSFIGNGCPSGGEDNKYRIRFAGGLNGNDYGHQSGVMTADPNVAINVYIRVDAGITVEHLKFYPMLRLSTETDPTFEPYSNICPITGHTQSKVVDNGKNKINATDKHFDASSNKNELLQSNLNLKAGTYTLSFDISNNVTVTRNRPLYVINGVNTYAPSDYTSQGRGSWTFTLTQDSTLTFYWWVSANTSAVDVKNIQLELGSTATAYVPYNGYQITVNLGGTYYSGVLDVVTGVFTPDTAKLALNTSTIVSISKSGLKDADIFLLFLPSSYKLSEKTILSHYGYENVQNVNEIGKAWLGTSNTQLRIGFSAYGTTTLEDFKTWLDANNVEGCFELATPLTIQLTPQQVKALVGENHLSAPLEGQEITESKYRELFTWSEVEEIAQKIADSKIDDRNTSDKTAFSSYLTESRYAKKVYDVPLLTPYYQKSAGATDITFNNSHIFNDYQTSCELIQIGSGPRVGISNVSISSGSVTFTFDAPLAADTRFVCSIINFY